MDTSDKAYLPLSFNKYTVTDCGKVFGIDGEEIQRRRTEDGPVVKITWAGTVAEFPVALLVIVTFSGMKLPGHHYGKVVPIFIDGNVHNCNISNLRYRFKDGPLEVDGLPGFYYIPFFTSYAISREGVLMSLVKETPRIRRWAVLPGVTERNRRGGYLYARIVPDGKGPTSIYKHRALCLVFKPYPANVDELVINHLDGDSSNNDLDNIVWSTHSENAKHAFANGMKPNGAKAVLVRDLKTGEITRYNSLVECAQEKGYKTTVNLGWRIHKGASLLFPDYLQYKLDDGSDWLEVDLDESNMYRHGRMDSVAAWNVFTNEVIIFQGIVAGSKATGVSTTGITGQLAKAEKTPVNGWVFRYAIGDAEWPRFSEWHLKLFRKHPKHPPKGIVATHIETGEEEFFCDRWEVSERFGIEDSTVMRYAREEKVIDGEYRLRYYPLSLEHVQVPSGRNPRVKPL